ncbi:MAG TPA: serine/threonine-protein kinase [Polyangiaceae bacterium]|nr:serine/threonine-protein kinase [Polyangiaceae bacterium]
MPPVIGGRYRPIRLIGRGGMGSVYLVHHVHTDEAWALKVLMTSGPVRDDLVMRFKREARALARIRSDHVVRVIDADTAPELNDAPYYVMEFLEGVDLESVTAGAPQPARLVVEWLRQAARGLERAHGAGIVHRDLKPENLFLTRYEDNTPLIKVLDFGIAKVIGEGASKTQTGAVLGTPLYMSYEQANGDAAAIGPATDIWALGMIAYRLLTGQNYWGGEAISRVLAEIIYVPVSAPSSRGCDFGPAFDAWFLRSCDQKPQKRWGSVREQADALAEALRGIAGVSLTPLRPSSSAMPVAPDVRPPGRTDTPPVELAAGDTVGPSLTASVSDVSPRPTGAPSRPLLRRRRLRVAALLAGAGVLTSALTYVVVLSLLPNEPVREHTGADSAGVVPPPPPAPPAPPPSATPSAAPDVEHPNAPPAPEPDASAGATPPPRPPGSKARPATSSAPPPKPPKRGEGLPNFNEHD